MRSSSEDGMPFELDKLENRFFIFFLIPAKRVSAVSIYTDVTVACVLTLIFSSFIIIHDMLEC